jgi:hypothetical protein
MPFSTPYITVATQKQKSGSDNGASRFCCLDSSGWFKTQKLGSTIPRIKTIQGSIW